MRRVIVWMCVMTVVSGFAFGDVVHLKNGGRREGKIVDENDDEIVLEIRAGTATARVTIKTEDIERIEKKRTDAEMLDDEFRKRLRRLKKSDANAVVELSKWCVEKKRYRDAEDLLKKLAARDDGFTPGTFALAEMEYHRKRYRTSRKYLESLLAKDPANAKAKELLAGLAGAEGKSLTKLLAEAKAYNDRGDFARALRKAESFYERATPERAKKIIADSTFAGMKGFGDFVAELRLKGKCPSCKAGLKVCPTCKGKPAEPGKSMCLVCAGKGQVICSRCGGSGLRLGDIPNWQFAAVAHALERRATADAEELAKIAKLLSESSKPDQVIAEVSKATVLAARAVHWLDELDALSAKHPGITQRNTAEERTTVTDQFLKMCVDLGEFHSAKAEGTWRDVQRSGDGMLAKDKELHSARKDLVQVLYFFGRLRAKPKDPYPAAVAAKATAAKKLLATLEGHIKHNDQMFRAYRLAKMNYNRGRLGRTLRMLVALVENGSKPDLLWISTNMTTEMKSSLAVMMAFCRFEIGKEKGKFGVTTKYERAAFIKKLLQEADSTANLAHANYERMSRFLDYGRRNDVPTSMVRRTWDYADDARQWYRAVFDVPYPVSARKRKEIDDQIDYMTRIISRCRRWYVRGPVSRPLPRLRR